MVDMKVVHLNMALLLKKPVTVITDKGEYFIGRVRVSNIQLNNSPLKYNIVDENRIRLLSFYESDIQAGKLVIYDKID